jgi:hypothetical protein
MPVAVPTAAVVAAHGLAEEVLFAGQIVRAEVNTWQAKGGAIGHICVHHKGRRFFLKKHLPFANYAVTGSLLCFIK